MTENETELEKIKINRLIAKLEGIKRIALSADDIDEDINIPSQLLLNVLGECQHRLNEGLLDKNGGKVIDKETGLQKEKVDELMKKLDIMKCQQRSQGRVLSADILGELQTWFERLHKLSMELMDENEALQKSQRQYFAGMAIQGIISSRVKADFLDVYKLTDSAFQIADEMVKYGKEKSKTKGTEDGLGTTCAEDSNRE